MRSPWRGRRSLGVAFFLFYSFWIDSSRCGAWFEDSRLDEEPHWCEAVPRPVYGTTVVLLFTYSRDEYLRRALERLVHVHPGIGFPVVVTQDLQDSHEEFPKVGDVIEELMEVAKAKKVQMVHWRHTQPVVVSRRHSYFVDTYGYHKIARHYFWALSNVFRSKKVRRVIILEDDDEIAVDFFEYFSALAPLLDFDPTLYCVSAWNDNGKAKNVDNATQLFRTDWMPGRGWMMNRRLWKELEPKWPVAFWDDWLRAPDHRHGRQCIRPEISRVANFGERGISRAHGFKKHTSQVILNTKFVNFPELDLSYLAPDAFEHMFFSRMANATVLRNAGTLKIFKFSRGDPIILYSNLESLSRQQRAFLDVHADPRYGIQRGSYQGVVVITQRNLITDQTRWIFLIDKLTYLNMTVLPGGIPKPIKTCC